MCIALLCWCAVKNLLTHFPHPLSKIKERLLHEVAVPLPVNLWQDWNIYFYQHHWLVTVLLLQGGAAEQDIEFFVQPITAIRTKVC